MNTSLAPDPRPQPTFRYARFTPRLPQVSARLGYLEPMNERPYNYMYPPPEGAAWQNCVYDQRLVDIADARRFPAPTSVHREGFELWDAPSQVKNFLDEGAITGSYYPEAAELAKLVTGAAQAFVFDHLVRKREANRPPLTFGREDSNPAAVGRIHNDYTEASGQRRLALVLGGDVATALGRYSIVNIWRSIKGPILDTPLAVCDARSLSIGDLVSSEIRYPTRNGEIYLATYADRHRWAYYSEMDRHEALVFKQYDSQVSGVARFTPHAAFDHPECPPDAPLRESIELRCLVVYD
jgi:hypothetical protein